MTDKVIIQSLTSCLLVERKMTFLSLTVKNLAALYKNKNELFRGFQNMLFNLRKYYLSGLILCVPQYNDLVSRLGWKNFEIQLFPDNWLPTDWYFYRASFTWWPYFDWKFPNHWSDWWLTVVQRGINYRVTTVASKCILLYLLSMCHVSTDGHSRCNFKATWCKIP